MCFFCQCFHYCQHFCCIDIYYWFCWCKICIIMLFWFSFSSYFTFLFYLFSFFLLKFQKILRSTYCLLFWGENLRNSFLLSDSYFVVWIFVISKAAFLAFSVTFFCFFAYSNSASIPSKTSIFCLYQLLPFITLLIFALIFLWRLRIRSFIPQPVTWNSLIRFNVLATIAKLDPAPCVSAHLHPTLRS